MIVNGYNGVWSLDHDDGSSYYNDSSNFLVFGGCKNYKGDHKICGPDNVILYPGIDSRSSGARSCQTNDNAGFKFDEFIGNKCIRQFLHIRRPELHRQDGCPLHSPKHVLFQERKL